MLCVQDSSSLNFAKRGKGLGVGNQTGTTTRGLHLHATVNTEGLPLGVLRAAFDAPQPGAEKDKPRKKKKSYRPGPSGQRRGPSPHISQERIQRPNPGCRRGFLDDRRSGEAGRSRQAGLFLERTTNICGCGQLRRRGIRCPNIPVSRGRRSGFRKRAVSGPRAASGWGRRHSRPQVRQDPGARVALLAAVQQVPVQRSAGLPVLPHVLVDPLVADPALKAQAPRDLLWIPRQLFLDFAPPGSSSGAAPRCGARSPAGGLTVAAPARVAGQADHRTVAAKLLPWRSTRRFPSGPSKVPGRSGDGSLWANLRFGLTIA